ncbi:hypothetical protein GCK32_010357 [Trichostrongylus colubriformis]|uniref:Uncharacterized protein n=1 Tax=Trichostrongylus colubriformis TaxID=6319 RepID=A0AAN8FPG9_TRICO
MESTVDFFTSTEKPGNHGPLKSLEGATSSASLQRSLPHSEEANEVTEMLALIEADEQAEKAEAALDSNEIKRLREKTRAQILSLLRKRVEKMSAEMDQTTMPSSTSTTLKSTAITTTTTSTPRSTSSTAKMTTSPSTTTTVTSTTTTTSTTAPSTTTTQKAKGEDVAFKQIPEAEGYEPPAPLLQARAAASAKAAGVRTYEPPGRDLLVHSDGENSIIGYGTQLAREILNPGSLQRDREERQKALAAKIAHLKENLKYRSNNANEVRTIPIYQALMPPPLLSQRSNTQSNTLSLVQQPGTNTANPTLPPFFVAPPPGYVGPLPPPPPPPPLPPPHYSLEGPRRAPVSDRSSVDGTDTTTLKNSNTVYYPVESDKQPAFTIESRPTEVANPSQVAAPVLKGPDSTGFERGRSEVRTIFMEDSGGRRPTQSFEQAASSSIENASSFRTVRKKFMKH